MQEKLRLSKEMRDHEKFRDTLLCPNCRHPTKHSPKVNINMTQGIMGVSYITYMLCVTSGLF